MIDSSSILLPEVEYFPKFILIHGFYALSIGKIWVKVKDSMYAF